MNKILIMAISMLLFYSCNKKEQSRYSEVWVPIYGDTTAARHISSEPSRLVTTTGKIYIYNNYLFQIEHDKGIHIYEFKDRKPEKISFIKVLGSQEISINQGILYTNNYNDLVGIDIAEIENVKVVSRIPDLFNLFSQEHPPISSGYFICVDKSKGSVIGWSPVQDTFATCRFN